GFSPKSVSGISRPLHIQQQISECTTAIGTNKPAEESTFEKLRAALPDLDLLVFEEKADTH
ncbi:hypothetical protein ACSER6_00005, partial [Pseudomonas aeruginosa]